MTMLQRILSHVRPFVLSDAATLSYAHGLDARQFPYFCAATGELADSLRYVIRATFLDLFRCGVLHCWKRTRSCQ